MTIPERAEGFTLVEALAWPKHVIVVGGSADAARPSGRPLDYLRRYGFPGEVTVVSPERGAPPGRRFPWPADDVTIGDPSVAILALPAVAVPEALAWLNHLRVKAAVVVASGFEDRQSQLRRELESVIHHSEFSVRVLGPNCVGSMAVPSGAHLNFSSLLQKHTPPLGGIALVTQSGALGNGLVMSIRERGGGISYWFSSGDEVDLGALELCCGLIPRPEVTCIGVFLEAITDMPWLERLATEVRRYNKQVFVLKGARTSAGRTAAGGHTGRIVGPAEATAAVLEEAGLLPVHDLAHLTDCLLLREAVGPLTRPLQLAVATVSGASGVVAADRVEAEKGLALAPLFDLLADAPTLSLDRRLELRNPLDIPFLGETEVFCAQLDVLGRAPGVDVVVAVMSSLAHDYSLAAEQLRHMWTRHHAPLILCSLSEDDRFGREAAVALAKARICVLPTVERAVSAVAALSGSGTSPGASHYRHSGREEEIQAASPSALGMEEGRRLAPDLPWLQHCVVAELADCEEAAAQVGFPCVIKAAGRVITHRSDLGAVMVADSEGDLPTAFAAVQRICEAHGDVVLVQEHAPSGGTELFVSVMQHAEVGPVAVLSMGGVLAELMDVQVLLPSIWSRETRRDRLVSSTLGSLLTGFRNTVSVDIDRLLDVVERLLEVVRAEDLAFMELNPVIAYEDEIVVVDCIGEHAR